MANIGEDPWSISDPWSVAAAALRSAVIHPPEVVAAASPLASSPVRANAAVRDQAAEPLNLSSCSLAEAIEAGARGAAAGGGSRQVVAATVSAIIRTIQEVASNAKVPHRAPLAQETP